MAIWLKEKYNRSQEKFTDPDKGKLIEWAVNLDTGFKWGAKRKPGKKKLPIGQRVELTKRLYIQSKESV